MCVGFRASVAFVKTLLSLKNVNEYTVINSEKEKQDAKYVSVKETLYFVALQ